MKDQGIFTNAHVISSYSRAQAIEDGNLVDLSETSEYKELRFRLPIAITSAVLGRCIEVPEGVVCQDWHGRLWDLLWMFRQAVLRSKGGNQISFGVHVRNDNSAGTPPLVTLKALCGPGDKGEPVVTILLPEED